MRADIALGKWWSGGCNPDWFRNPGSCNQYHYIHSLNRYLYKEIHGNKGESMANTGYAKSTIGLATALLLAGCSVLRAATFLDSIPLDTLPEERAFVLGRVDGRLNAFYIARGALFRRAVEDGTAGGATEICKTPGRTIPCAFARGFWP